MRLAFWRAGKDKAVVQRAAMPGLRRPAPKPVAPHPQSGDLDLRALGQALMRKRGWIIVPTVLALVLSLVAVNMVTPRYKSEARILIDGRENVFLRPNGERNEERSALDAEAVTSQVQLRAVARSRPRDHQEEQARRAARNSIRCCRAFAAARSLLALFGIGRDPFSLTPEERVLEAYYDRFTAYAVDKSRVIVVEFQSRDPRTGRARRQLDRRRLSGAAAGRAAGAGKIREPVAVGRDRRACARRSREAESRVEDFRSKSSLFVGTNNTTLSNQQMGELNTQLNNARALKSDAEIQGAADQAKCSRAASRSRLPKCSIPNWSAGCPNSASRCARSLPSSPRRCSTAIPASRN